MAIAAGRVVTATRGVWLAGREGRRSRRVVRAAWIACPDMLMRVIALHTERAGCSGVRPDVLGRAGLCRCHTGRAADTP